LKYANKEKLKNRMATIQIKCKPISMHNEFISQWRSKVIVIFFFIRIEVVLVMVAGKIQLARIIFIELNGLH
jgi:hypothetical protein